MKNLQAVILLSLIIFLGGCISISLHPKSRSDRMVLETLQKADGFFTRDKVLLVGISGVLSSKPDTGGFFSKPSTVVEIKDILKKAEEDDSIKALLLRVDTPGGSVIASDLIYHELKTFKERTGKKIVVICMGVAASGGYYLAMAADSIYMHPASITGSIGVIGLFPSIEGLSSKIGFEMRVVKSGEFKDTGSLWRSFSSRESAILQGTIDYMYERFLEVVAEGRPNLKAEAIRRLADGRVYHAQQALENGLVDEIGYMEDALLRAKELAGITDASLVVYKQPNDYRGHYYASAPSAPISAKTQINLLNLDLGEGNFFPEGGPFHYLWLP